MLLKPEALDHQDAGAAAQGPGWGEGGLVAQGKPLPGPGLCVTRLKPGPTPPVLGAGGQRPWAGCWSLAPWLPDTTWQPGPARATDGLGSHPKHPRATGQHFHLLCVSEGNCPVSSLRAPGRGGAAGPRRHLRCRTARDRLQARGLHLECTQELLSSQSGPWSLLLLGLCLGCRTQLNRVQGVPSVAGGTGAEFWSEASESGCLASRAHFPDGVLK